MQRIVMEHFALDESSSKHYISLSLADNRLLVISTADPLEVGQEGEKREEMSTSSSVGLFCWDAGFQSVIWRAIV